jgi:hypothetical protein
MTITSQMGVNMDWMAFLSGFGGAALGAGILGVLLESWLDHRFSRVREIEAREIQRKEKQRDESRAVAEILSEWVRSTYTGKFENEDRWRMQTTYWKNILGLDPKLIRLLFPRLANAPGAVPTNELIVQARKMLLNLQEVDIKYDELNNWLTKEDEAKRANTNSMSNKAVKP